MGKKVTKIAPVRQTVDSDYAPVKRVCAYCRVSTGTDEQKKSFDAQVQYYTQKIAQNPNWAMTKIYTDEARSGTKVQRRDGFQQMIQDCKRGNIDLFLQSPLPDLQETHWTAFTQSVCSKNSVLRCTLKKSILEQCLRKVSNC